MKLSGVLCLAFLMIPGTLFCACLDALSASDVPRLVVPQDAEETASDSFRRNVIQSAVRLAQEGQITRRDLVKLRVAMMSPAFRAQAEDLAIVQMSASGSDALGGDAVPVGEDGKIERANIDWDALLAFIEKLIPLILQLIDAFSELPNDYQSQVA